MKNNVTPFKFLSIPKILVSSPEITETKGFPRNSYEPIFSSVAHNFRNFCNVLLILLKLHYQNDENYGKQKEKLFHNYS